MIRNWVPGRAGHDLDAGGERATARLDQLQMRLAVPEQAPEMLVDRIESLDQSLAAFAIELLDGLVQLSDGEGQVAGFGVQSQQSGQNRRSN